MRGFNDRTAIQLPTGRSAFYQPINKNESEYMLPFPINTLTTSAACMDAPLMCFIGDTLIHDEGRYDAWNTARDPGMGMSHWTREDFPYYFTLLDNFLVGDQYFQSTFTETNPNRLHFFSGSNGLSVGQRAIIDNEEHSPGWTWETFAETLENANVSWRVFQEEDNFDDNGNAWFASFQSAQPGSPLYEKGIRPVPDLVAAFAATVEADALPSVSWLIAPEALSEHAANHPPAGEDLTARLLAVMRANPAVYAKTLFVLNYDEGGQFFDHHWTPTPPMFAPADGASTVDVTSEIFMSALAPSVHLPIGLGFRVPLVMVSPWTRGPLVLSEVLDHTALLKLVERRFNVTCPNISPWRRAITGDATAAFDFARPDYSWPDLPDTSNYTRMANDECDHNPRPTIPAQQRMPVQEAATRISRALPYEFAIDDAVSFVSGKTDHINGAAPTGELRMTLTIANTGAAGAPFLLVDQLRGAARAPRKYAVESGKTLVDEFVVVANDTQGAYEYALALHGPNGFLREFSGVGSAPQTQTLGARMLYEPKRERVVLQLRNDGSQPVALEVADMAYKTPGSPWSLVLAAGEARDFGVHVGGAAGRWYDLRVQTPSAAVPLFERRFMGRMETGSDSTSDPAMAAGVPAHRRSDVRSPRGDVHPLLPERLTHLRASAARLSRAEPKEQLLTMQKDAVFYPQPALKSEL